MKSFGFLFITALLISGCDNDQTTLHEYWVCEEYCMEMQVVQSATPVFTGELTIETENNPAIIYSISGSNNPPNIEFYGCAKGYCPVYGSLKWVDASSLKGMITENGKNHYISFNHSGKKRLLERQVFPVNYAPES
jgi:hypothetical protein